MKSLNDFNSHPRLLGLTLSRFTSTEETREPRTNRVCSTHQLSSIQRIQSLCGPLRRQQARATVLMLGPIPDHGVCPINLPREFARHRSVSAGPRSQALSLWLSWSRQAFYVGRCQRDSRLENLRRFRAPLSIASGPNFLCHSGQRQPEFSPPLFTSGRSPRWHSQRSNHRASRTKEFVALSHGATPSQLSFARNRSATGAFDQQLLDPSAERRRSLSLPLANRTLLQMDQTTSAHQEIFRYFNQQRQDANLDRRRGLCAGSDYQATARSGPQSLHNSTDLESHAVRENAAFTSVCRL